MRDEKRVKIDDMSKALYAYTTDKNSIESSINILDKNNNLDRNAIKIELTLLIIIIIDYLIRSQKFKKRNGEKANQLMISYLSHFKNETEKIGTGDSFIDLLEERGEVYNRFIENDTPHAITHSTFLIIV